MEGENKKLGNWGEDLAVNFLRRRGFFIIERNFYTTYGEIDIVAKCGNDYYFIEVKTRRNSSLATDLSVGYRKKQSLKRSISRYCLKRNVVGDIGLISAIVIIYPNIHQKTVKIRYVVMRD